VLPNLALRPAALGGGGLARLLIHLFIWHELFRLVRYLWRIPTVGPFLVAALGLVLIGLIVWRQSRRSPNWGRTRRSERRGSAQGRPPGPGPRDW